jgi:RecB family endonuclease NucS
MDLAAFAERLQRALDARETLVALVRCDAMYSGRAETFLPAGERILIVKADRSVLLHRPDGSAPVNYMKSGSEFAFERSGENAVLRVRNAKEKAWLELGISHVLEYVARRLDDGQELDLAGSERDMSNFLRDHPALVGNGFVPVMREEQTDVGFIDLFGHDGKGGIVVVECKRVTASLSSVDQLRRYVERVKKLKGTDRVTGVLAAPAITPNALEMLRSFGFSFASVQPPKRLDRWRSAQKGLGEY